MRREYRPDEAAARRAVSGARWTTISVAAGALATLASLGGVAYVATMGSSQTPADRPAFLAVHTEVPRGTALVRRLDEVRPESARPVSVHRVGDLAIVDIGAQIVSLDDELDRQRTLAAQAHEQLVLWLTVEDCKPCNAVETALSSTDVQKSLPPTRFVRVDAIAFLAELSRMGVPMDAFPAFVLLGADDHAVDYIHGGEWDDDLPENIAPVLKRFVEGTLVKRRSPWHGGLHEDEMGI